ncbi:MAG: carbamoyltransferase C-terminal domain-containing protein [Pseudorhodoferax sp.]
MLHPRQVFFGDASPRWRGRGACIALLDSGIGTAPGFGTRLVNEMGSQYAEPVSLPGNSHALRVASLCAEGDEIGETPGGPLGLAPETRVLSAAYAPLLPLGIPEWAARPRECRLRILGLPWSAAETPELAHPGRASIGAVTESMLVVAAAGHDGRGRLRFPGTSTEALTVGMCDAEGRKVDACGADEADRKPELLVPAGPYAARREDGGIGSIGGTSAAVGLVCGLAALWVERLLNLGMEPSACALRAALLAGSRPGATEAHRLATADGLVAGDASAVDLSGLPHRKVQVRLRPRVSGRYRLAFSTGYRAPTGQWLTPERPVVLQCGVASAQGDRWCIEELVLAAGEEVTVEVSTSGRPMERTLVAVGPGSLEFDVIRSQSRRRRPVVVLGLSASHDASACVMVDGRVEAAIQLERLTRVKHDGAPYLADEKAAAYVLESAGFGIDDIDAFAFNAQPLMPGWVGLGQPCPDANFRLFDPFGPRSFFVSHHLGHAFAAFYGAGFDEATVLVADGAGGSVHDGDDCVLDGPALEAYLAAGCAGRGTMPPPVHVVSTYAFDRRGFRLAERELASSFNVRVGSSSLGEVYAAVSQYVFGSWQDSGKLMGLAPYGDPAAVGDTFLVEDPTGLLHFGASWKNRFRDAAGPRNPMALRDLAARVQRDLEESLLQRVRRALRSTGLPRLAYAGGLALNCVTNGRIVKETPVSDLFVFPASHDAGISIGVAAAAHHRLTGEVPRCEGAYRDFLGHAYGRRDHEWALRVHSVAIEVRPLDMAELAQELASGRLVAWFQGGSEFGPRALGHRSILADPRERATWQRINAEVKYREDFRPFAPIVPVERAADWFELEGPAPYMTRTVRVRSDRRHLLGAVTHLDGSARVQTVDAVAQPLLHELLLRFGELTGVPVLLNTSLNVRGQPLVETPLQAVELLLSTQLDVLVLGERMVRPRPASAADVRLSDRLALAPDARVASVATSKGVQARIESALRPGVAYGLEPWCAALLHAVDGQRTLEELLPAYMPAGAEVRPLLNLFTALRAERLLV